METTMMQEIRRKDEEVGEVGVVGVEVVVVVVGVEDVILLQAINKAMGPTMAAMVHKLLLTTTHKEDTTAIILMAGIRTNKVYRMNKEAIIMPTPMIPMHLLLQKAHYKHQ